MPGGTSRAAHMRIFVVWDRGAIPRDSRGAYEREKTL